MPDHQVKYRQNPMNKAWRMLCVSVCARACPRMLSTHTQAYTRVCAHESMPLTLHMHATAGVRM